MSVDVIALLAIVLVSFALFIHGRLSVDLVGLMVLSALVLAGLVSAHEALAGFSSPAVVTVWALFILTAGLTRTGIAHQLGKPLLRFAHHGEATLVVVLMVMASLLSALINTVTVAAVLLPATMQLARCSGLPPSRLLMPLALGSLLGGPFTGISTPPNILITDALSEAGLEPFGIFDFTPITAATVAVGILFMVLVGRRLLPNRTPGSENRQSGACGPYQLDSNILSVTIPQGSPLHGRSLAESRLGSALYLTVLALKRGQKLHLAPGPDETLLAGDTLIAHGSTDYAKRFHGSQHLQVEPFALLAGLPELCLVPAEAEVAENSPLVGSTLAQSSLRRDHQVHALALRRAEGTGIDDLRSHKLEPGDRVLLQGRKVDLEALAQSGLFSRLEHLDRQALAEARAARTELLPVRVPEGSVLAGHTLAESRLGNAFGLTVVGLMRGGNMLCMPRPEESVQPLDLLLLQGSRRDLETLEALQGLEIAQQSSSQLAELESQQVGVTEVLLSPRTNLSGRTLAELRFRERYNLNVLAVWSKGQARRIGLQDMPLQFGDALLVYGQRHSLEAVARDPDFLVLDQTAAQAPRLEKARVAAIIMAAVILSAITGLLPISVAALVGATFMVLSGCLSMEEAYRAIEWRVVFLIAAMLPLGAAIKNTGAAEMGATALIAAVGDLGPRWVVAALFTVTALATQIIPTAALVVLMAPIALSAAKTLAISPHLLMMTVALAASASFASPLSHPAHLLVMGPGGYKFTDYVKVGVPITILALLVNVLLLPLFWPPGA